MSEIEVKTFKAISDFISDLHTCFPNRKDISLYNRLVEKITFRDTGSMLKHITAFKLFFQNNPKFLVTRAISQGSKISYNERIFINFDVVWKNTNKSEKEVLYKHLTTIFTILNIGNPEADEALQILRKENEPASLIPNDTKEGQFINDTINELESQMGDLNADNPMEMVGTLMQSGFLNKFVGDLQNKFESGEMDMQKLLGSVTGIIQETSADNPEANDMINNTMKMLGGGGLDLNSLVQETKEN